MNIRTVTTSSELVIIKILCICSSYLYLYLYLYYQHRWTRSHHFNWVVAKSCICVCDNRTYIYADEKGTIPNSPSKADGDQNSSVLFQTTSSVPSLKEGCLHELLPSLSSQTICLFDFLPSALRLLGGCEIFFELKFKTTYYRWIHFHSGDCSISLSSSAPQNPQKKASKKI